MWLFETIKQCNSTLVMGIKTFHHEIQLSCHIMRTCAADRVL